MKLFWTISLICIVLGNSLKDKETLKKAKTLYELSEKNRNRKLQENTDDTTDGEIELEDEPKEISAKEATEDLPKNQGKSIFPYQIKKFYGFISEKAASTFSFHMFLAFFQKMIPKIIKMRLRILYASTRLRNLEAAAQSVRATCEIRALFEAEVNGDGENIDYLCTAPKDKDRELASVNLDTTIEMDMDGTSVSFDDVNFSDEAYDQASNISSATSFSAGWIVVNSINEKFVIKGKPQPQPFLNSFIGKTIRITFVTIGSRRRLQDNKQTYDCKVNSDSEEETEIQCDGEIKTTKFKLKYATSEDVALALLPGDSGFPDEINANSFPDEINANSRVYRTYRNSSSGLSGGAIAGIVIPCVVVAIAAAVAVIMLKKPSPPIDNTTNFNLKQENI